MASSSSQQVAFTVSTPPASFTPQPDAQLAPTPSTSTAGPQSRQQLEEARDNLIAQIGVLEAGPSPGDHVPKSDFDRQAAELKAILSNIREQLDELTDAGSGSRG